MAILIDLTHLVVSWRGAALGVALAALADCLGLFAPGAKRKRTPEEKRPRQRGFKRNWRLRHNFVCGCVRYPSADGTMIDENCGQCVTVRGAVRVNQGQTCAPAGVRPRGHHGTVQSPEESVAAHTTRARTS